MKTSSAKENRRKLDILQSKSRQPYPQYILYYKLEARTNKYCAAERASASLGVFFGQGRQLHLRGIFKPTYL